VRLDEGRALVAKISELDGAKQQGGKFRTPAKSDVPSGRESDNDANQMRIGMTTPR
jgi:hypothetical protein